jgi:HEAT repeat protein/PBS lyase HEAT-like repeat-containing protein
MIEPPAAVETVRSTPSEVPSGTPDRPSEASRQTTPFLVLQFFIFPLAIVAVCVTVFLVFGLLAGAPKPPRALLAEVRSGGGMFNVKRWQAAYALANALEKEKDLSRRDPAFVDDVVKLYAETASGQGDDVLVRRYLALTLGRLGDPRAVPTLRSTLAPGATADAQTLIFTAWALGAIGDPTAVPDLAALARSEDAGFRKAAVHALGAFSTAEARQALVAALEDPVEDVRWNAALHLARRGDPAAVPVLVQMMDRDRLGAVGALTPEQREDVLLQAVSSAAFVDDESLRASLRRLGADPSLPVREAARAALERRKP